MCLCILISIVQASSWTLGNSQTISNSWTHPPTRGCHRLYIWYFVHVWQIPLVEGKGGGRGFLATHFLRTQFKNQHDHGLNQQNIMSFWTTVVSILDPCCLKCALLEFCFLLVFPHISVLPNKYLFRCMRLTSA